MAYIDLRGYRLRFDANGVVTECSPPVTQAMFAVMGQRDPRWMSVRLGNSGTSTIGQYGCWIVCQAILLGITPREANLEYAMAGGFQAEPRGAYWNWVGLTQAPEVVSRRLGKRLVRHKFTSPKMEPGQPRPSGWIDGLMSHLASGQPAVLDVDIDVKKTGQQQHFVVALPAPLSSPGDIKIIDPWDIVSGEGNGTTYGRLQSLLPEYGATVSSAVWRYSLYEVTNG